MEPPPQKIHTNPQTSTTHTKPPQTHSHKTKPSKKCNLIPENGFQPRKFSLEKTKGKESLRLKRERLGWVGFEIKRETESSSLAMVAELYGLKWRESELKLGEIKREGSHRRS